MSDQAFMKKAIELAQSNIKSQEGGPFGAVIVLNGEIIAQGRNQVLKLNDPTAHAEIQAIRDAADKLKQPHLNDCILYSSCEPCPMCFSAIYWARIKQVYFAATRHDAAEIGFIDAELYEEIVKPLDNRTTRFIHLNTDGSRLVFQAWQAAAQGLTY